MLQHYQEQAAHDGALLTVRNDEIYLSVTDNDGSNMGAHLFVRHGVARDAKGTESFRITQEQLDFEVAMLWAWFQTATPDAVRAWIREYHPILLDIPAEVC
jgi:hypothetical protein